jgi:AcrR family transcriptional regulator
VKLATELRMSAMTLYKHFASKHDLVSAMVDA